MSTWAVPASFSERGRVENSKEGALSSLALPLPFLAWHTVEAARLRWEVVPSSARTASECDLVPAEVLCTNNQQNHSRGTAELGPFIYSAQAVWMQHGGLPDSV